MNTLIRSARIATIALILTAITADAWSPIADGTFRFLNFFGYFTNQSNLIAVLALGIAAYYTGRARPEWVEYLRAASVVYLIIVTTVYWTLLAPTWDPALPWANFVVHLVSGVIVLADWLLEGPRRTLPLARFWVVLVYPAVWLLVVLVRGATDGWVPYPFLEPDNGYASIAVVVTGIIVIGTVLAVAVFKATKWRLPAA